MTVRHTLLTARALCGLLAHDITLTLFGFNSVRSRLKTRTTSRREPRPETTAQVCQAVNLAAALYFKPVRCLQKSVVTFHLLRSLGADARMVAGWRPSPFFSHAWVEVGGEVVNDSPAYKQQLKVLWTVPAQNTAGRIAK